MRPNSCLVEWKGRNGFYVFLPAVVEIHLSYCRRHKSDLLRERVRPYMCFSHSVLFGRIWVSFWPSAA